MICALEGKLVGMSDGMAQIAIPLNGLVYEVMIPVYAQAQLESQHGQVVRLSIRHYFESQAQGAILVPRLVGFQSDEERAFFELLTTVKGLGVKRALRAMVEPPAEVAGAIVRRDHRALQKLPEIGKRLAETIIVDLADKVARFAHEVSGQVAVKPDRSALSSAATQAVAALVALGHTTSEAERAVDRALALPQAGDSVDEIITAALTGG